MFLSRVNLFLFSEFASNKKKSSRKKNKTKRVIFFFNSCLGKCDHARNRQYTDIFESIEYPYSMQVAFNRLPATYVDTFMRGCLIGARWCPKHVSSFREHADPEGRNSSVAN